MQSIKSYTDINQSKKLAEILPLESADMYYREWKRMTKDIRIAHVGSAGEEDLSCWSLAALFGVLPNGTDVVKEETDTENEKYMCTVGIKDDIISIFANTPVDACVAMIEKLHKIKLL